MPAGHSAPATPPAEPELRLCARVLALDPLDRVLLIHARDPDDPSQHWWELPGGGIDPGETPQQAARRELTEETGLLAGEVTQCLWVRQTRFRYRGHHHHRRETVYLARIPDLAPAQPTKHTPNEKAGLLGHRWWNLPELSAFTGRLLPPTLPQLVADLIAGQLSEPLTLDA
jgi:8-oxo-dGTP pyrophosphatase MutT (NUDIX family)